MQAEQKLAANTPTALSEYEAIGRTVQHYIYGGQTGKSDEMRLAFHPDATIFGYVGPELLAGPIQYLYDWVDKTGAATELQGRITSTDIVESVATVRLELENWSGYRFTDMFTLLKVDGEWKIINKVFHLHA
jgi:putative lumazine-binding protein